MKFGIIGLGKVGLSLCLYLKEKNIDFFWWTRSEEKRKEFENLIGKAKNSAISLFKDSDFIFISIKDDEIENFLKDLNLNLNKQKFSIHLSGSLPVSILNPLKEKKFKIGSFHPIQTFPFPSPLNFKNIYASFVGDEEIYEILRELFKDDVKIIKVNEEQKFLIHIASTISSNFFVFLLRKAEEILKKGEINLEILFPLIQNTFENVKKEGTYKSITGPAKRRDYNTIFLHEKYIFENFRDFFKTYLELTKGILKDEVFREIKI
jgi:predicted short-subunit dehydrogenase-like oxidoreductase (DUF2520 family)